MVANKNLSESYPQFVRIARRKGRKRELKCSRYKKLSLSMADIAKKIRRQQKKRIKGTPPSRVKRLIAALKYLFYIIITAVIFYWLVNWLYFSDDFPDLGFGFQSSTKYPKLRHTTTKKVAYYVQKDFSTKPNQLKFDKLVDVSYNLYLYEKCCTERRFRHIIIQIGYYSGLINQFPNYFYFYLNNVIKSCNSLKKFGYNIHTNIIY